MALLTCQNVSLAYEGKEVVTDLSFEINAGDYLCIVGVNGSGKSTLIKGLLGLMSPTVGSVIMGDGLKQTEIGYLPQQTNIQRNFPASVYEVVISGCLNSRGLMPFYKKKDKQKALDNIEKLGIANLRNKCYKELSGGQQQRVLLARALCATKKILLLDEPVTGLDPIVTSELYYLIRKINKESEITVVMVSHDIRSAVENANIILHLNQKPLFFGKTAEYKKSEVGRKFIGGEGNV